MEENSRIRVIADRQRMEEVKAYVVANLSSKLKSDLIAEKSGYSKSTLLRHFYLTYNYSLCRFILDSKMNKACELIKESNKFVCEVAQILGYKNCSAFTHAFKRYFGYPPMQLYKS